jgi:hypothetical protein
VECSVLENKQANILPFTCTGVTRNIGEGGVLFETEKSLTPGWVVRLKIKFPPGQEESVYVAEVLRVEREKQSQRYKIACCFIEVEEQAKVKIQEHVDKRLNQGKK